MKKALPIFLMLTILSLSLLPASTRAQSDGERLHRREARRSTGAQIRLERTDHDFGDITRHGGEVSTTILFRNVGSEPLVLTRLTTTCSCLKCDYPKRPVPVDGQGEIRLTYQPLKAEPGTFHKVVHVFSNSVSGREIITIRGNSLDK